MSNEIPVGYCQCGCGEKTRVPKYSDPRCGHVAGEPVRFIRGHSGSKPVSHFELPSVPEGARLIQLTQGKVVIVDEVDYQELSAYNWHVHRDGKRWYAISRQRTPKGGSHQIRMHRLIMNAPDGVDVDHIDGNGLNNTRMNLRLATRSQNSCNRNIRNDNTSGYKGVSFHRATGKWQATITVNGKSAYLGLYATAEDAGAAYDEVAGQIHGQFARTNEEISNVD